MWGGKEQRWIYSRTAGRTSARRTTIDLPNTRSLLIGATSTLLQKSSFVHSDRSIWPCFGFLWVVFKPTRWWHSVFTSTESQHIHAHGHMLQKGVGLTAAVTLARAAAEIPRIVYRRLVLKVEAAIALQTRPRTAISNTEGWLPPPLPPVLIWWSRF